MMGYGFLNHRYSNSPGGRGAFSQMPTTGIGYSSEKQSINTQLRVRGLETGLPSSSKNTDGFCIPFSFHPRIFRMTLNVTPIGNFAALWG